MMREDWVDIKFKEAVIKVSTTKQKLKQSEYLVSGKIPVVDQGQNLIGGYTNEEDRILDCNLPVIVFGDHTKIVKLINFPFAPGADGTKVLEPKKFVLSKYVSFLTNVIAFQIKDKGYARHYQHIEKEFLPLPPLPIQRAIVSKIETLFSDLDNGIADLKKAQNQLKIYRQAVLKKAFEGEFDFSRLGDIAHIIGGVTKGRKLEGQETTELPYLRVANVQDGFLNLEVIKYIKVLVTDLDKYRLIKEDVLFTEGGDRDKLGRGTVWKDEIANCIHQNHIFRARVKEIEKLNPYYLTYYAQSPDSKNFFFKNGKQTTNLASINKTVLSNLPIPLPPINKQHQIVKEIESRLSVCDKVEESISIGLEKAKALRQSILKKAFEGNLLSEAEIEKCKLEADYEPASVLLERIKKDKAHEKQN